MKISKRFLPCLLYSIPIAASTYRVDFSDKPKDKKPHHSSVVKGDCSKMVSMINEGKNFPTIALNLLENRGIQLDGNLNKIKVPHFDVYGHFMHYMHLTEFLWETTDFPSEFLAKCKKEEGRHYFHFPYSPMDEFRKKKYSRIIFPIKPEISISMSRFHLDKELEVGLMDIPFSEHPEPQFKKGIYSG